MHTHNISIFVLYQIETINLNNQIIGVCLCAAFVRLLIKFRPTVIKLIDKFAYSSNPVSVLRKFSSVLVDMVFKMVGERVDHK